MMAASGKTYSGSCLCGGVAFDVIPAQEKFGVCHCAMCRKWAGGPYFAIGCGADVEFSADGPLKTYASSDWAERGFCGTCGTSLFYRLKGGGSYQMAMGSLEGVEEFAFTSQIFVDEQPKSYAFANETRKLTGREVIDAYLAEKTAKNIDGAAQNG